MTTLFHKLLLGPCAALVLSAAVSGCKEDTGTEETHSVAWKSGDRLGVNGLNGEVRLERGPSGEVSVVFKPFAINYADSKQADADMKNKLHFSITNDAANGVVISTTKDPGTGSIGAHMIISLPPEFDTLINIDNGNGEVDVDYVGQATQLFVDNRGAGDCKIDGAPSVVDTNIRCGFEIRLDNVSDAVNVNGTGIGDVSVSLARITAGSAGGTIIASDGNVSMALPASAQYSVQATAQTGTVNEGSLPSGCKVAAAGANSKTVSCASGPNYRIDASDNVTLSYR